MCRCRSRAERVCEECRLRGPSAERCRRHAGVDRIRVGLVGERVAVPHRHVSPPSCRASLVQMSGLSPRPDLIVVVNRFHTRVRALENAMPCSRHPRRAPVPRRPPREPEGVVLNRHHEARRAQTGAGGADLHRRVRAPRSQRRRHTSDPGQRRRACPASPRERGAEPDADDVGRDRGDGCDALAVAEGQACRPNASDVASRRPTPLRVAAYRRGSRSTVRQAALRSTGTRIDRPALDRLVDGRLARSRAGWFQRTPTSSGLRGVMMLPSSTTGL